MDYKKPKTLEESLSLAEANEKTVFLGGGTDLAILLLENRLKPDLIIDLTGLDELKKAEETEEGIYLGAGISISALASPNFPIKLPSCLALGAAAIGSPQIRNMATLGGNICNASPCGDTLAPLVVLNALFCLRDKEGTRKIPALDFFIGPKKTVKKEKEILEGVLIPKESLKGSSAFFKTGKRKGQTISQVNSAVYIKKEKGSLSEIRIAAGSVAPTPVRLKNTEEYVKNNRLQELEEAVLKDIKPISDIRGSEEYRKKVTAKAVARMVKDLLKEDN